MLRQRVITACVLALIALWVVLKLPAAGFGAVLLAVLLLCAWEWAGLAGLAQPRGRLLYGGLVLAPILAVWPLTGRAAFMAGLMVPVFAAWCGVLVWLWRYAEWPEHPDRPFAVGAAGVAALAAAWAALMGLRHEFGPGHVLFLLMLIWVADIGAYFAGRRWGRRKLAPTISPGKTWEGVWGAAAATLAFALIGAAALGVGARWPGFVVICIITVGFSIVGDLFESMLKRRRGVKDSGSLLPGHGGVLDRLDSLIAAAPVFLLGWHGLAG
jgi:phosphatidate cytidylyltransferase